MVDQLQSDPTSLSSHAEMPLHHSEALAELREYEVVDVLSMSPASCQYIALSRLDESKVVLSILTSPMPSDAECEALRHSYAVAQAANCAVLLAHLGVVETNHGPVLITEYVGITSLAEICHSIGQTKLSIEHVYQFAIALMSALKETHEHYVIHRGLHPKNILWDAKLNKVVLQGLEQSSFVNDLQRLDGRPLLSVDTTTDLSENSTLWYMAPECTGRLNFKIDVQVDFYSVGCLLYQLLGSRLPFEHNRARELVHAHVAVQPKLLLDIDPSLPESLCAIVHRLLAKQPADRYRSATGVLHDILRSAKNFEAGEMDNFELAERDGSRQFKIAQRLYGREKELKTLTEGFDGCLNGSGSVVFVSGHSGVGKSALIGELQQPIVSKDGLLGIGKFDQFRRDVPYLAWIAALDGLIHQLLAEPELRLAQVKADLALAVGHNGSIVSQLVPSAKLLLGDYTQLQDDTPLDGQLRFTSVIANFITAIANSGRPVVLFLDDLQWADTASIHLLEALALISHSSSLMIVGAYRSNEVDASHALDRTLHKLRLATTIEELELAPLNQSQVGTLVADALICDQATVVELAELVMRKTAGNPFFVLQFLAAMHRDELISFDVLRHQWQWNIRDLQSLQATENVVDLLPDIMRSWPESTQKTMCAAACIGERFDLAMLSQVLALSTMETAVQLQPALQTNLISHDHVDTLWYGQRQKEAESDYSPRYRFQHDRIQQSAFDGQSEQTRSEYQYSIAKVKLAAIEANSFDDDDINAVAIMDHTAMCVDIIISRGEQEKFIVVCLAAVKQAKRSMAMEPAWQYLQVCRALLSSHIQLVGTSKAKNIQLQVYVELCDTAYLSGRFDRAEEYAQLVLAESSDLAQRVSVHNAIIGIGVGKKQYEDALQIGMGVLAEELDIIVGAHTSKIAVLKSVVQTQFKVGRRKPEDLINLPLMQEAESVAAMSMLMKCATNAYWGNQGYVPLIATSMVQLSIEKGNTGLSAYGYALYGMVLAGGMNLIKLGYDFGELAMDVLDKMGEKQLLGRTGLLFHGFIRHSLDPMRLCAAETLALFELALDSGDIENACYCGNVAYYTDLLAGKPLSEAAEQYSPYLDRVLISNQSQTVNTTKAWMRISHNLRSADGVSDIRQDVLHWPKEYAQMIKDPSRRMELGLISSAAGWLAFLLQDWEAAETHFEYMYQVRDSAVGMTYLKPCLAMYAVVLTRNYHEKNKTRSGLDALSQSARRKRLNHLKKKIRGFAKNNPHDFESFSQLVVAEELAGENNMLAAAGVWVDAAELARDTGFQYVEAWAIQRAADGHAQLGHIVHAKELDGRAKNAWLKIGALACVKRRWGQVGVDQYQSLDSASEMSRLDFSVLVDSVRAVAGTFDTQALVQQTLELTLQATGGKRATLLTGSTAHNILATSEIDQYGEMHLVSDDLDYKKIPISLVDYIVRTKEIVTVDDAKSHHWLSRDTYVQSNNVKSVVGVPLLRHNNLIGVVVVENNLGVGLFSSSQLSMVEAITGQAAVSLENARLFDEQTKRAEAFLRFVPHNFLEILGRSDISEVGLGEAVQQQVTVLFADVRDFTPVSEALGPEGTFNLLNDFFAEMNPIIVRHGGFVDEFMGDGIKALFLGDANSAVEAGIAMQTALRSFNLTQQPSYPLSIGIGVHTGIALLGTVGAEGRMSTKAIGDSVNVASRVEGLTKMLNAGLLVTQDTIDHLVHFSRHLRLAGKFKLIGRSQVTEVFEVVDARVPDERSVLESCAEHYDNGLAYFYTRDFAAAKAEFAHCLQQLPQDVLARRYYELSQGLIDNPPASGWAGVEDQLNK